MYFVFYSFVYKPYDTPHPTGLSILEGLSIWILERLYNHITTTLVPLTDEKLKRFSIIRHYNIVNESHGYVKKKLI